MTRVLAFDRHHANLFSTVGPSDGRGDVAS